MALSVEWIRPNVGIARAGPHHRKFLDPWTKTLVIDGQRDTAILKALSARPTKTEWRALYAELRQRGYRRVVWFEVDVFGGIEEKSRHLHSSIGRVD